MRLYANQPIGTVPTARDLRRNASSPERTLLRALREALPQFKWRHQTPVGPYFVDILCFETGLAIEVDGDTHAGQEACDAKRTAFIEREGFRVTRFANSEVAGNLDGVIQAIQSSLSLWGRGGAYCVSDGKGEDRNDASRALPSPRAATRLAPLPTGEGK